MPDDATMKTILGVDNAIYTAAGVPIEISYIDLQTFAETSDYLYVGNRGIVYYNVDMSADETQIMSYLGGLYVVSSLVFNDLTEAQFNALTEEEFNELL